MEFFKDARGKTVMDLSCGSGVRMLIVCAYALILRVCVLKFFVCVRACSSCVPMLSFCVCLCSNCAQIRVCSNSCVCPLLLCVPIIRITCVRVFVCGSTRVCGCQGVKYPRSIAPGGAPPRLLTPQTCFVILVCFQKKKLK
jgi:hypothetical protein